jgi:hypothetical protein
VIDPQLDMFAQPPSLAQDAPRLSAQCRKMIERLRQGPATNADFVHMGIFKYTSRISDARAAGYDVRVVSRNHQTGVTLYRLFA